MRDILWKGKKTKAVQFDGTRESIESVQNMLGRSKGISASGPDLAIRNPSNHLEFAKPGDWIIIDDRREYLIVTGAEMARTET